MDHFHDECGVFGVFKNPEASNLTYLGLYAQQHRGQESAGIVSTDGRNFNNHRGMGLVADIFTKSDIKVLTGESAIGHVRYSTSGESGLRNAQPFTFEYAHGGIAMCHNGNIVNAQDLRKELETDGSIFQSTSDTEVLIHLVAKSKAQTTKDRLSEAISRLAGGFSLLVLTETRLFGIRDRNGIRPLVLGKLDESWVLASETCAFDLIGATYIRDIKPGEMVLIDENGLQSFQLFESTQPKFCVFEYVYFARPDSTLEDVNVYQARYQIGVELAKECPVEADLVIPVPDSGVPPAMGYAEASGIPFQMGLIRNHYIGRTFIEPQQSIRNFGVKLKLNPNRKLIEGKRVILVDDSIVRGTTSRKIVEMVRAAGAAEVHMRISSPPTKFSCFYGVDTPDAEELMANKMNLEEMRQAIRADTLAFVSFDGMYKAVGKPQADHCDACFSGNYPVSIDKPRSPQLSLLRFFSRRP
ncbi:MAG: amidophosphoribosyltransferase [Zetaproteobacteria bacterium CG_4_9_14_3_um_filter_49_83]|nr:MAG: amidophosphoribosyltransferase [Zetaproteobacteria bacterium CG17_big_fil_post_rev_8_21_14_2_50_50_13]PIV29425.1 MAG: amidophosphoribosyltransferase [Zetaproteobacteria bacterium CG02_land_8_20_14_3_00_50_9]PIY56586.1 MAG: amidophosphoribosyltransferase [Zetaproteobacteria bacterium CG_4_10_14_0_8_um_filter_49_80]PJA34622.1 MAG: amidophosphoribosyltransferase [Zetaproteobacteria bacterium CG_4_9_14_3_um_filter_49_83]